MLKKRKKLLHISKACGGFFHLQTRSLEVFRPVGHTSGIELTSVAQPAENSPLVKWFVFVYSSGCFIRRIEGARTPVVRRLF